MNVQMEVLCFTKAKQKIIIIIICKERYPCIQKRDSVSEQAPAEARLADCRRNGHRAVCRGLLRTGFIKNEAGI